MLLLIISFWNQLCLLHRHRKFEALPVQAHASDGLDFEGWMFNDYSAGPEEGENYWFRRFILICQQVKAGVSSWPFKVRSSFLNGKCINIIHVADCNFKISVALRIQLVMSDIMCVSILALSVTSYVRIDLFVWLTLHLQAFLYCTNNSVTLVNRRTLVTAYSDRTIEAVA